MVEVTEDQLPEEQEMEQIVEDLLSEPKSERFPNIKEATLLDQLADEGLLELLDQTDHKEEEPLDKSAS